MEPWQGALAIFAAIVASVGLTHFFTRKSLLKPTVERRHVRLPGFNYFLYSGFDLHEAKAVYEAEDLSLEVKQRHNADYEVWFDAKTKELVFRTHNQIRGRKKLED